MSVWIFLRGLTRESRHWGNFPDVFCREVANAQVLAVDLPGNGRLFAQESPLLVDEMVAHCRAQLVEQGVLPPYYLLAMSLGAMVAVAWAQRYPTDVLGCVLINSSLRSYSPFYRRLKPRSYLRILKLALPGSSERDWESTILDLTSRHVVNPDQVLEQWISYRHAYPVSKRNALRQLLAAFRYRPLPDRPEPPLLVLASEQDGLVDVSCSRQLALRWNAAFAAHPTAGHDLPLDDGPWLAGEVRRWLQALP